MIKPNILHLPYCRLACFICLPITFANLLATTSATDSFEIAIRPVLQDYCVTCHSTEKQEGELDLERFNSLEDVQRDIHVWERVQEQLSLGEMPPKDAQPLSAERKQQLSTWVQQTLNDIALASAGDPGPVVLRRLSNHEYTYTLRDLTGIDTLEPAKEFPVDGAAGEGFTNVGSALVMSPALLSKYLDAAKVISQHAVLLPNGIRFSPSTSPQDWTDELLVSIRAFYARHTSRATGDQVKLQGIDLDTGSGEGRLTIADYVQALQGQRSKEGLSPKYLRLLRQSLESKEPSVLLDPLRTKYATNQLSASDIEPWQNMLWKFSLVGHVGRPNGPQGWQEKVDPLANQQEFRVKLQGTEDHSVYLIASSAGDGTKGDQVLWENARLIAKDRPDIPIASLDELQQYLVARRTTIINSTEQCLAALANRETKTDVDPELLTLWGEYLGMGSTGSTTLEPLLLTKIERHPDYAFIQGWTAGEDLSVLANSSDNTVRTPGTMPGHSIAVHPSPSRATVVAWRSPVAGTLKVSGRVLDAHLDCGDGVTWAIEVRRGQNIERLAAGVTEGGQENQFGPFENVRIEADHVIALIIGPRDNHVCDLTSVDLTISNETSTWDLAKDISPNILKGNPNGQWHYLSQPASAAPVSILPATIAAWQAEPNEERARQVREYLRDNFPLTHPLLASAMRNFRPSQAAPPLSVQAPDVIELKIPAELSAEAELVITGKLASPNEGSVQLQVFTSKPTESLEAIIPNAPIIVGEGSPQQELFRKSFEQFRELFPITLCYSRIVPVDEVVTLRLFYREDEHLQRLMLDASEIAELNRLWDELLFVSQAPLKQVDAFEQIYQFATQDRPDLVVEFEKMREPIQQAAAEFQRKQQTADAAQRQAVIDLAARAWRRPLTDSEQAQLRELPPRLMLTRIFTSPSFLYRIETPGAKTGPVNDWELATRLSYFLWSSLPDDELYRFAAAGKLRDPDVLASQARRMLKDEKKIRRLATEFGCQYLHVRDVATLDEKSQRHFPNFNDIRDDMQEEVTRFFIDLFQNNRSVISLLDANYSFMNRPLANHYGIPVNEDDWQLVDDIQQYGRGGILGFAATLAKHSGASRSSAILRGMWLSEVVLGDKTPNPPKGVPTLPEEPPEGLSERQLIERHSSDPACAGCHLRIDPYGFALEGFDAIGRTRQAETQATLYDGTTVAGMAELREYLIKQRSQTFIKQFSRKLLGYAIGRSVQLSDQPLIDKMVQKEGHLVGDHVEEIVRSSQFREIRGQTATHQ